MKHRSSKTARVLTILFTAPVASTAFCYAFVDAARGNSAAEAQDFVMAAIFGLVAFLNFIALIKRPEEY